MDGVCSTEDSVASKDGVRVVASKDGVRVKASSTGKGPLLYCVPC